MLDVHNLGSSSGELALGLVLSTTVIVISLPVGSFTNGVPTSSTNMEWCASCVGPLGIVENDLT